MATPIYLRDLSADCQKDWLMLWAKKGKTSLIQADKESKDITIGYYLKIGKEAV